ncbi:MAG: tail fiber domain-containing protein [Bacteroidetes bacterium]|nr:tail fiber domain-containing protein [Bacteroidota bacterium]
MKTFVIVLIFLSISIGTFAQVAINSDNSAPNSSSMLDVKSSTLGLLIPRMTTVERLTIINPAQGLIVYDTDLKGLWYYHDAWIRAASSSSGLTDADDDTKILVEKYPDDDQIHFSLGGTEHWLMTGTRLEPWNSGGSVYIGMGAGSMDNPMYFNSNVGIGLNALGMNTSGYYNTALGGAALTNSNSYNNTAIGSAAMTSNNSGYSNTAVGVSAMDGNLNGYENTAIGEYALGFNRNGFGNVAVGFNAGFGSSGFSKSNNSIFGYRAGYLLTSGSSNILLGYQAGSNITSGANNIMIGYDIGGLSATASSKMIIGASDLLFGDISTKKIGIGTTNPGQKLTVGDGNFALSNTGTAGELMLYEPSGSGSNYTSIKAQAQDGNNTITLPKDPGTNGQFLSTNATGVMSWSTIPFSIRIQDTDGDTKVQVEKTTDEDKIRFNLAGTEKWVMDSSRLEPMNSGRSVFIGEEAGQNDDLSTNDNVFIGYKAARQNTVAEKNIAIGSYALYSNVTGEKNVAIGKDALFSNVANSRITAIGYQAMLNADNYTLPLDKCNTAVGYQALMGVQTPEHNTGYYNTAVGDQALCYNGYGYQNTALGRLALFGNIAGQDNTAIGFQALYNNNTSCYNTAVGVSALYTNSGSNNTAIGRHAMYSNESGVFNTASGVYALANNIEGDSNTAIGVYASEHNTTGSHNASVGAEALNANTAGAWNTALGSGSLQNNINGNKNTAVGKDALHNQAFANGGTPWDSRNTAIGVESLYFNNWGESNTAIGERSAYNTNSGDGNTALGAHALEANYGGDHNTAIGFNALFSGDSYINSTALGWYAQVYNSNETYVGNVYTEIIGGGVEWSSTSDERFKTGISESVPGLDFINKLRPVTYYKNIPEMISHFRMDNDEDIRKMSEKVIPVKQTGFLAQEVEQAAKELGYDFNGVVTPGNVQDSYRLRYGLFVVPLVKAVKELAAQNEQLKKENEAILKRLEALEQKKTQ